MRMKNCSVRTQVSITAAVPVCCWPGSTCREQIISISLWCWRASTSKMSTSTHFSGAHSSFSSFLLPLHHDLLSAPLFLYPSLLSYPFPLSWTPWCPSPVTESRQCVTISQRRSCCQESLGCRALHQWTHHLPFPLSEEELLRKEGDGILLKPS